MKDVYLPKDNKELLWLKALSSCLLPLYLELILA